MDQTATGDPVRAPPPGTGDAKDPRGKTEEERVEEYAAMALLVDKETAEAAAEEAANAVIMAAAAEAEAAAAELAKAAAATAGAV